MKQAYQAANAVDAQMAIDLLACAGIEAHLQGQFLSGAAGELPMGELLRVWVPDADLDRARDLLAGRALGIEALEAGELDPLLARSWRRAWQGLGAGGEGLGLREELLEAWSQPQRRYHSLRHLRDSLALLEPVREQATHPEEVEMALWFHDAVYDPKATDNEQCSADWAEAALARAGVDAPARERICALVLATRHAAQPVGCDEQLLVDIDLAILGAGAERFDEYEVEVREEYAWVPAPLFRRKRRQILQEFLDRPALYSTPQFAARFEGPARANLARSLAGLEPWWKLW